MFFSLFCSSMTQTVHQQIRGCAIVPTLVGLDRIGVVNSTLWIAVVGFGLLAYFSWILIVCKFCFGLLLSWFAKDFYFSKKKKNSGPRHTSSKI